MSSLIMGRQRRGKIETSTLVDPATMTGADQLFPLGYKLVLGPSAIKLSGYGSTLAGSFPQSNTTPLADLGPSEWVYIKNASALVVVIVTGAPVSVDFECGMAVCSLATTQAEADDNVDHVPAASLNAVGAFSCDVLRTSHTAGGNTVFSSSSPLGFAQGKIASSHYGFIQTKGAGAVLYHATDGSARAGYSVVAMNDQGAGAYTPNGVIRGQVPLSAAVVDSPIGCGRLLEQPTAFGLGNPTLAFIHCQG